MSLDTASSLRDPPPQHALDVVSLTDYLMRALPGSLGTHSGSLEVKQFSHGQSNPTFLVSLGPHERMVLRKQPPGKLLASAHAVDREHRVLSALAGSSVPVPRPLLMCSDASVIGTPFYCMDFAQGTIFTDPNLPGIGPRDRGRIYGRLADTLADLHSLSPQALGLAGFGEPANYCRRQVSRWSKQYAASVPSPAPPVLRLSAWLGANVPAQDAAAAAAAVVHGDYRLDNVVWDQDLQVSAVLDWELATLGNSWADVAYLCMPYHLPAALQGFSLEAPLPGGIPSEQALLARYCSSRGLAPPAPRDWAFYLALSIFRLLAILAGVQARARQGNASSAAAAAISSDAVLAALADAALGVIAAVDSSVAAPAPGAGAASPGASAASSSGGGAGRGRPARAAGLGGPSARAAQLLARLQAFMQDEVYPAEAAFEAHAAGPDRWSIHPLNEALKAKARAAGLWNLWMPASLAAKLGHLLPAVPEAERATLLGAGLSHLDYAHLCAVMGSSLWAPELFNCSAPDTGNMEVLAKYGTPEQQRTWLLPLLRGQIRSCFAMTEKAVASSDATNIQSSIRRLPAGPGSSSSSSSSSGGGGSGAPGAVPGPSNVSSNLAGSTSNLASGSSNVASGSSSSSGAGQYELSGLKWWTSGAMDPRCMVAIFMGKSDPAAPAHRQQSMLLVPMGAPGVRVIRPLSVFGFDDAPHGHAEVAFDSVVVPAGNLLLGEGRGFEIAQGRLGPGRLHHCMRLIGMAERALGLAAARALQRSAFGGPLAAQGGLREVLARQRVALEGARLLVLNASAALDSVGHKAARGEIAAAKVAAPAVALQVIDAAIQIHGGAGVSQDVVLPHLFAAARTLRIADGPDEVHLGTLAKLELEAAAGGPAALKAAMAAGRGSRDIPRPRF